MLACNKDSHQSPRQQAVHLHGCGQQSTDRSVITMSMYVYGGVYGYQLLGHSMFNYRIMNVYIFKLQD